ncbi:MAG TPA: hypothetical protein VK828_11335 [Terriglobales bacterium]|jgi:hypothetical protein|nr:hypothetical protein [Terriglobales bacterium]
MREQSWVLVFAALLTCSSIGHTEDLVKDVRKAVERSTLDQPGTKPFHLRAVVTPSFARDKDSGRTGEVEIWWASPTQWRRESRSPEFHQIEIVDGAHDWQKNEGNYFPEWLRETAIELIQPVRSLDQVLDQVKTAEIRHIGPMTHIGWTTTSGTAEVKNILRSSVALHDGTGLLLYAGGFGWGGEFKDYASFHGRMIARTVNVGSPQVTAKVTTLEDLRNTPAGFFDATAPGGDAQPLQTALLDETSLRRNLLPMGPAAWPPVQDGPFEGNVTTIVVVDREGKIREMGSVISENSVMNQTGKQLFAAMQFKPFVVNGVPVQAMSQVTIPFKTSRPIGVETFESAGTFFERGRHLGFPASGTGTGYVLRAEFEAKGKSGTTEKGRYEDTWLSDTQWRREAWFSNSHYVRSRNGEQAYQFSEGEDGVILRIVLKALEPIPAIDTFTESDWRIRRDTVDGIPTVRVLAGYQSPEGKLDPEQARGYWFDSNGQLVKTYFKGMETRQLEIEDFAGVKVARRIDVLRDGGLVTRIRVTGISSAGTTPAKTFEVPGHEWTRAFTDEVR